MKNKKEIIIVTGGAGFIGSHIVDAYIKQGHTVFVIDNLSTGFKSNINPKAHFLNIDIRNKKILSKIISKIQPTVINHHAAQVSVVNSLNKPIEDAKINIIGLLNILDVIKNQSKIKFIFASSGGAIYGDNENTPNTETDHTHPLSPYGIAKEVAEKYILFFAKKYNFQYLLLRYANVYGPRQIHQKNSGVISIFISNFINKKASIIFGNGKNSRDYIFIDDITKVNMLALKSTKSGTYNIGTGVETTTKNLFKLIASLFKSKKNASYRKAIPGEVLKSSLNSNLAKNELKWEAKVDLKTGLEKTIEWFNEKN